MRELLFELFFGSFIPLGDLRNLVSQHPAEFATQNAKELSLGCSFRQDEPLPGAVCIRVEEFGFEQKDAKIARGK